MSAAEKRTPTDTEALAVLHDEGNDLVSDLRTIEAALMSRQALLYTDPIASTLRRCTDRLLSLLDRLEAASDAEASRLADAADLDKPIALVPTAKTPAPYRAAREKPDVLPRPRRGRGKRTANPAQRNRRKAA